jgi:hypothetical protein
MRQSAAMAVDITDPRRFPERADAAFDAQIELAASSLGSSSTARAAELDQTLTCDLVRVLRSGDASWIEGLLAAAPSAEIRRHFWRRLLVAWDDASRRVGEPGLAVTLFALPIVIVAGRSSEAARTASTQCCPTAHVWSRSCASTARLPAIRASGWPMRSLRPMHSIPCDCPSF